MKKNISFHEKNSGTAPFYCIKNNNRNEFYWLKFVLLMLNY